MTFWPRFQRLQVGVSAEDDVAVAGHCTTSMLGVTSGRGGSAGVDDVVVASVVVRRRCSVAGLGARPHW